MDESHNWNVFWLFYSLDWFFWLLAYKLNLELFYPTPAGRKYPIPFHVFDLLAIIIIFIGLVFFGTEILHFLRKRKS